MPKATTKSADCAEISLLVFGAPDSETLDALVTQAGGGGVVVVEPDPDIALRLQERPELSLVAVAPARKAGPHDLKEYNFPGLRSTFEPTPNLLEALPGLQERSRQSVPGKKMTEVMKACGLLAEGARVTIDLPGAEHIILKGLRSGGSLEKVAWLSIRCGAEVFFQGATSHPDLVRWLEAEGFTVETDDISDADWLQMTCVADLRARALRRSEKALAAERDKVARGKKEIAELRKTHAREVLELETARRALDEKLQQRETELTGEIEAAHKRREDALAAQRDAHAKAVAELRAAQDARAQVEKLGTRLKEVEDALEIAQQAAKTGSSRIADLEDQHDKTKRDLAVALRLQMLAQSDLKELQDRYKTSEKQREHQQDLLQQLTPRLQEASRQLQQLALPDVPTPGLDDAVLADAEPDPDKNTSPDQAKDSTSKDSPTGSGIDADRAERAGPSTSKARPKR